jgi:hypothetical protein
MEGDKSIQINILLAENKTKKYTLVAQSRQPYSAILFLFQRNRHTLMKKKRKKKLTLFLFFWCWPLIVIHQIRSIRCRDQEKERMKEALSLWIYIFLL